MSFIEYKINLLSLNLFCIFLLFFLSIFFPLYFLVFKRSIKVCSFQGIIGILRFCEFFYNSCNNIEFFYLWFFLFKVIVLAFSHYFNNFDDEWTHQGRK